MKKVYKYRQKYKLEQGRSYPFYFFKKIKLPDELNYFVIKDPFGNKHLIPEEYYRNYSLETGKEYLCKIDKINCLGRIFIEPPHPYFEEGKSYAFKYQKTIRKKHKSGNICKYYLFTDKNLNQALMDADKYSLPEHLKKDFHLFQINKISKGVIYLSL